MVTPTSSRHFSCWKCEGNIGEAVEKKKMLCSELEIVREFTYLDDRESVGG